MHCIGFFQDKECLEGVWRSKWKWHLQDDWRGLPFAVRKGRVAISASWVQECQRNWNHGRCILHTHRTPWGEGTGRQMMFIIHVDKKYFPTYFLINCWRTACVVFPIPVPNLRLQQLYSRRGRLPRAAPGLQPLEHVQGTHWGGCKDDQ